MRDQQCSSRRRGEGMEHQCRPMCDESTPADQPSPVPRLSWSGKARLRHYARYGFCDGVEELLDRFAENSSCICPAMSTVPFISLPASVADMLIASGLPL